MDTKTQKALAVFDREVKGCLILIETVPADRYDKELADTLAAVHSRLMIAWSMLERTLTECQPPRRRFW